MTEERIPDRSDEPALQDSLDKSPRSTTASNSDQPGHAAKPDQTVKKPEGAEADGPEANGPAADDPKLDDETIEETTGIPASSQNLSTI